MSAIDPSERRIFAWANMPGEMRDTEKMTAEGENNGRVAGA